MKNFLKTLPRTVTRLWSVPIINRAGHTFWQAFGAVFALSWLNILSAFQKGGLPAGKAALLAVFGAAVAAGFSALRTMFMAWKKKINGMA